MKRFDLYILIKDTMVSSWYSIIIFFKFHYVKEIKDSKYFATIAKWLQSYNRYLIGFRIPLKNDRDNEISWLITNNVSNLYIFYHIYNTTFYHIYYMWYIENLEISSLIE